MAKRVSLTNAEIITFPKSEDYLKEIVIEDKGTIMAFNVKTRINDRVPNSPWAFERCSMFADNQEQIENIRNIVKPGNLVEIKGFADRRKGKDKEGGVKYYDELKVKDIVPINVSEQTEATTEDDLPF